MKKLSPLMLRTLGTSLGALVSVLPLMVVRLLIVAGVEGAGMPIGSWLHLFYLPIELLFPVVISHRRLAREPLIRPLRLASVTTLYTLLLVPMVLALFTVLVYASTRHAQGFAQTAALVLGLSPVLGVFGLLGLILLCSPILVSGWGLAWLLDSMVLRKQGLALANQAYWRRAQGFKSSWRERCSLRAGRYLKWLKAGNTNARSYAMAQVKGDLDRWRAPLIRAVVATSETLPTLSAQSAAMLTQVRAQSEALDSKVLDFYALLLAKLVPQELTWTRYSDGVQSIYQALTFNLMAIVDQLSAEKEPRACTADMAHRLEHNAAALSALDLLIKEIGLLPDRQRAHLPELDASLGHLNQLVAQVKDYRF